MGSTVSKKAQCPQTELLLDETFPHFGNLEDIQMLVFSYLTEKDLCRVEQVCKQFRTVSNSCALWRRLYKWVFEYDLPLFHPAPCTFEFVSPEESVYMNPWKESFKQLYKGIHVSNDGNTGRFESRGMPCFSSVREACKAAKKRRLKNHVVFVHTGTYQDEGLVVDSDVSIIGAASGDDVAKKVIIEPFNGFTVTFLKNAKKTYLGYVTLQNLTPLALDMEDDLKPGCIEMSGRCSPLIDHCIIKSSFGIKAAVIVKNGAKPTIRSCYISDSSYGLCITRDAQGIYENNEICRNERTGILVDQANPLVRKNRIYNGRSFGVLISDRSSGNFEGNEIYKNKSYGVCVTSSSNPTIRKNNIYQMDGRGLHISHDAGGVVEDNDIHDNAKAGLSISHNSDPVVRHNKIHSNQTSGIYVLEKGRGQIEGNDVYNNGLAGIFIKNGTPILRQNRIFSGKEFGVCFADNGQGRLEDNDIFDYPMAGVLIRSGSDPVVRRNKIKAGVGVAVVFNGRGLLEENDIHGNESAGVLIQVNGDPTLRENNIYDGVKFGVCVTGGGKGVLERNSIFRNGEVGVLISSRQTHPVLRNNKVFDCMSSGVEISDNATATLEGNQIFNNRYLGLDLASGVWPICKSNEIYNNRDLVEKEVALQKCLFKVSNGGRLMHDYYNCRTCQKDEEIGICLSCVKTCHAGHDTDFVRHDRFCCDCGSKKFSFVCKLQEGFL